MNIAELLGIDLADPEQALADRLVREDERLLDELIAARVQKNMTISDVAELIGVDDQAVAIIESGERDPRLSTLRRYALAVGAEVRHSVEPNFALRQRPDTSQIETWARTVGVDRATALAGRHR